mmetsp:Transcript_6119/g.9233  ORF Transcript_6119/g.9233 Transcript_6119/m.9233 type:complete len:1075 (-) Transcript_6119:183-3407(-)
MTSAEELRELLKQSAFDAPLPPNPSTSTDIPVLDEIASLIGSIDFDSTSRGNASRVSHSTHFQPRQQASTSRVDISSVDMTGQSVDSSMMDVRDLLQNVQQFSTEESHGRVEDTVDYTVVHFGTNCTLRGRQGRVLTAVPTTANPTLPRSSSGSVPTNPQSTTPVYLLGVDGQGVGEDLDTLVLISADQKENREGIRFGDVVAIKSPAGKERYLGTRDSSRLGFWRHFIGQGERWTILKGSSRGQEEKQTRGMYVRTGDLLLLQNGSDMLLTLSEGVDGRAAKLVHKDRSGLGGEVWQIDWCGCQPTPQWMKQRPYLSGSYLMMSAKDRYCPTTETIARTFPGSVEEHRADVQALPPELNSFSPIVQEGILLRELILALSGVEGMYIRVGAVDEDGKKITKLNQLSFLIDTDSSDRGLAYQVAMLLSVCECANRIRVFIRSRSRYEYGSVAHAIAATIKRMMREFDLAVAQFEHLLTLQRLTIQKMVFLLQPTKTTLRTLDHMIASLGDRVGGCMLDRLHSAMLEQGDERAKQLYEHVLKAATVPFVRMISLWLYEGELRDPYAEFFIQEHKAVSREALEEDFNARYWEGRYTLRALHVPRILQDHAMKALTAGKYLNVIRDCCPGVVSQPIESEDGAEIPAGSPTALLIIPTGPEFTAQLCKRELTYDIDGSSSLVDAIDEAYQFSSSTLLKLLDEKYSLYSHFQSLRRFFLLEHGDFYVQFMDTAEEELRREAKDVALPRIQSLLHLAIHTSTLANDPNKDDVSCILASHNLIQHLHLIQTAGEGGPAVGSGMDNYSVLGGSQGLKGVEALTLEYKVGWPLSIILSRRAVTKYQLLSRLLFFCKHVELRVLDCWKDHQNTKEYGLRGEMGPSYCLRHRMLHFLQNFVYYMTIEVFTPRSHEMEEAMGRAKDMDEMLNLHDVFLDTCLKECLLASQDLLRILTKITTTCLLFADQMKRFASTNEILDPDLRGPMKGEADAAGRSSAVRQARIRVQSEFIAREVSHDAYVRMLAKFSDTFDTQLGEFLEKLWTDSYRHHPQLSNLCVRLDYNGFYDSRFTGQSRVVYSSSRGVV